MRRTFKGECMGVRLVPRDSENSHIYFEVMVEDDELWHPKLLASSAWLDELIAVLQEARAAIQQAGVPDVAGDGRQYGWRFKQ